MVEAKPYTPNDHKEVTKFLRQNIFSSFGMPRFLISNGGKHFCNRAMESLLMKYGVKQKVPLPYHP